MQLQFADEILPVCAAAWPQCGFADGDSNRLLGGNMVPVTIDTQSCRVVSASGRSALGRSRTHCWWEETLRTLRAPVLCWGGHRGGPGDKDGSLAFQARVTWKSQRTCHMRWSLWEGLWREDAGGEGMGSSGF